MMARYIALLRGINVGGRNLLPMEELVSMFEAAGCSKVRTYIQSGNVVFESSASAKTVATGVRKQVEAQCGFDTPIITRSAEEFAAAVEAMPYDTESDIAKHFHVGFFDARPDAAQVAELDPDRSPPDRFSIQGSELYVHCPNGILRSRLTHTWFESQLAVRCTMRNWNTVQRLLRMCAE
jgi:uncharacterized protein (DUF1697 family)